MTPMDRIDCTAVFLSTLVVYLDVLLAVIFVLPDVSIVFFSPMIFAIAFISLSRGLKK